MTDNATAAVAGTPAAAAGGAPTLDEPEATTSTDTPAEGQAATEMVTGSGCARLEPLLGANLLWFGRALNRRFEALLAHRGGGLTMAQARILFTLDGTGPVTQKDLAARTDVEPSTLGRTINLMERQGLVRRRGNPGDRRQRLVDLAVGGRGRIETLVQFFEETEHWLTHDMPDGSVRRMVEGLSALRERLAAEIKEKAGPGGPTGARRERDR